MSKIPLLIIGSSGHSRVIIDIVEKLNVYNIIGLIDPFKTVGDTTFSYNILGDNDVIPELLAKYNNLKFFVAIGDNYVRKIVSQNLFEKFRNIEFVTLIHPSAQIGIYVKIGIGVAIMAGVTINSNTIIHDFAILNTKSSIDHDCIIESFASIAPGAIIGGGCVIGNTSAISIGAILKHQIVVGSNSIVGAGALLLKDCSDNSVMYGTPAKFIRKRIDSDKYL